MVSEKFRVRAPEGRNGGGNGHEQTPVPSDGITFESLTDLKKNLIPWMRTTRLEKIVVYAYEGESDRQLGHFVVSHEQGRTTIEDGEGTAVALFGSQRASVGRARQAIRSRSRTMQIDQWLREKHCNPRTATFDVFEYEAGDEGVTESEAQIAAGELEPHREVAEPVQVPEVVEEPAPEPEIVPEPALQRKTKSPRRPKRRKPIQAELKARKQERASKEYQETLKLFLEQSKALSGNKRFLDDGERMPLEIIFRGLSRFLSSNREYRKRFISDMLTRPDLQPAYLALSMLHVPESRRDEMMRLFPKLTGWQRGRASGAFAGIDREDFLYMTSILDDLFTQTHLNDIYRTAEADNVIPTTHRSLADYYHLLYPDMEEFSDMVIDIAERGEEAWLEIGPGNTYKEAGSMINMVHQLNDRITYIGSDLLYAGESAAAIDKLKGWHELDKEWASRNLLVGASAQLLPYKDGAFDQVLSSWVFDKFNRETDAEYQAYRELARVLKPGGTARIFPIAEDILRSPFLKQYFDIKDDVQIQTEGRGELRWSVVLVRKRDRAHEQQRLRDEIAAWTQQYAKKPRK